MIDNYSKILQKSYDRLLNDKILDEIFNTLSKERLLKFLIEYNSRGVKMTEPVERWIYTAGQNCIALGYNDLGKALQTHAHHEANHHLMMIEDTHALVNYWNDNFDSKIDLDNLFNRKVFESTQKYIDLHEKVINSTYPFGQVAIEFEIESLSVKLGPKLIQKIKDILGPEIVNKLSFINEHVEIDVGHTALNLKMLERLLIANPKSLEILSETGSEALNIYLDFFSECWKSSIV